MIGLRVTNEWPSTAKCRSKSRYILGEQQKSIPLTRMYDLGQVCETAPSEREKRGVEAAKYCTDQTPIVWGVGCAGLYPVTSAFDQHHT